MGSLQHTGKKCEAGFFFFSLLSSNELLLSLSSLHSLAYSLTQALSDSSLIRGWIKKGTEEKAAVSTGIAYIWGP
jgi:hypothetical protein